MAAVAYLTFEEFRTRRKLDTYPADGQAIVEDRILVASAWVDSYTHRPVGSFKATSSSTKYFDVPQHVEDELWIPPYVSISAVSISADYGSNWSALTRNTDYWQSDGEDYDGTPVQLLIMHPSGSYGAFYTGRRALKITGVRGYSAEPPDAIKEAVAILTSALLSMKDGYAEGDRAIITGSGFVVPPSAVSPKVPSLLRPYVRDERIPVIV